MQQEVHSKSPFTYTLCYKKKKKKNWDKCSFPVGQVLRRAYLLIPFRVTSFPELLHYVSC